MRPAHRRLLAGMESLLWLLASKRYVKQDRRSQSPGICGHGTVGERRRSGGGEFREGRIDCPGAGRGCSGATGRPRRKDSRRTVTLWTGGKSSPPERNARAARSSLVDGKDFRSPRRRSPRIRGRPRRRGLRLLWRSGRCRRPSGIPEMDRALPGQLSALRGLRSSVRSAIQSPVSSW